MLDENKALTDARTLLVVTNDSSAVAVATNSDWNRVQRSDWGGMLTAIAQTPRLAAIYGDARGIDEETLPDLLAAMAGVSDVRLVIELAREQIDAVAAAMLPTDTVLLCEPTEAERTAALALAMLDDGEAVRDTSRDARRFEQLNAEVARFAETLARLTAGAAPESAEPSRSDPFVADRVTGFGAQPAAAEVGPVAIRRAIRARRLRDDAFDLPGLFEDPAWDMLLDLFAAELERRQVSVSSLCIAAAVAPTTALRWIGKLIEAGLLDRRPDDIDRRRAFISLTARASLAMRNYVAALQRAGLALA